MKRVAQFDSDGEYAEQYYRIYVAHEWMNAQDKAAMLWGGAFLICGIGITLFFSFDSVATAFGGFLMGAGAIYLYMWFAWKKDAKKRFLETVDSAGCMTVDIDGHGLSMASKNGKAEYPWTAFKRARPVGDGMALDLEGRKILYIPDGAFLAPEFKDEILHLARNVSGKSAGNP